MVHKGTDLTEKLYQYGCVCDCHLKCAPFVIAASLHNAIFKQAALQSHHSVLILCVLQVRLKVYFLWAGILNDSLFHHHLTVFMLPS